MTINKTITSKAFFRMILINGALLFFASCSTGVESTKKIALSREDRRALQLSEEGKLLSAVKPDSLKNWEIGKTFIPTDDKAALIFNQVGLPSDYTDLALKHKPIVYKGLFLQPSPAGIKETYIVFSLDSLSLAYRCPADDPAVFSSGDIPMLVDKDMIDKTDSILSGRKVWIKTALRYDSDNEKVRGEKFAPVTIDSVTPGDIAFPIRIWFRNSEGKPQYVYLNIEDKDNGGKSFKSIFSLSDPHDNYNSISDSNWNLIKHEKIAVGMTKEECRLSIGNPDDLDRGRTWNSEIDFWSYSDGTLIWFQDGLVVRYRRS